MGRGVTMRTVAERAGVSTKTVSNVVNGTGAFSPETERRVRAAVRELGYRVNPFAKGLRSRRVGTIAIALPNIAQPLHSELAEQVIRAPEARGLKVVLEFTRGDPARERAVLAGSRRELVDGVIYLPRALTPADRAALSPSQPTVVIGEGDPERAAAALDHVRTPDEAGAHAAVTHLLARGRSRVAVIGAHPGFPAGVRRLRGYHRALADAGVPADESLVVAVDDPDLWASGVNGATRLLRTRTRFDALYCLNDVMAVGALSVLRRSGFAVPEDVAVAGFDDIEAARYAVPPLTTVDPHTEAAARSAVALLRGRMALDDFRELPGRCEETAFALRVRASTAGPEAAGQDTTGPSATGPGAAGQDTTPHPAAAPGDAR
jgi:DNA-binding LacI/PurR family transcriptional regulator